MSLDPIPGSDTLFWEIILSVAAQDDIGQTRQQLVDCFNIAQETSVRVEKLKVRTALVIMHIMGLARAAINTILNMVKSIQGALDPFWEGVMNIVQTIISTLLASAYAFSATPATAPFAAMFYGVAAMMGISATLEVMQGQAMGDLYMKSAASSLGRGMRNVNQIIGRLTGKYTW